MSPDARREAGLQLPEPMVRTGKILLRFAPIGVLLTAPPLIFGSVEGDWDVVLGLLPGLALCAAASLALLRLETPRHTTMIENLAAMAVALPLAALISSAPYVHNGLTLIEAAFEGVSGVTSTGLTMYTDIEAEAGTIHFLRAWQQWIGGYLIVVLLLGFLSTRTDAEKDLAEAELGEMSSPHLNQQTARRVIWVYVSLTIACAAIVLALGMPLSAGINHALTAVSTAGFSTYNDNVGGTTTATAAVLIAFSYLGAIALSAYLGPLNTFGSRLRRFAMVAAALMILSAGVLAVVFISERIAGHSHALFDLGYSVLSAQTTTGYSTHDVAALSDGSKFALSFSMIVGGDIGSTAGGMKVLRFLAVVSVLLSFLGVRKTWSSPDRTLRLTLWICGAFLGLTVVGALMIWSGGASPADALFEMASATGTVGLSSGVTASSPPTSTVIVLIVGMLLGRVEMLVFIHYFLQRR